MKSVENSSKMPQDIAGGILITGSAGFIGREVAGKLAAANGQVVSMYHYRLPDVADGLYPFSSDLSSPDLLATPLRGINTVVHLAWSTKGSASVNERAGGPLDTNHVRQHAGTNIPMLRNLIAGMERAGTKRIIFLSGLGARRNCENRFLLEKYLCELMIVNSEIPEKIIIRSASVISGPVSNDRMVQSLLSSSRWPGVYPVPNPNCHVSPVMLVDIVNTICAHVAVPSNAEAPLIVEVEGKDRFKIGELFKLIHAKCASASKIAVHGKLGSSLLKIIEKSGTSNTPGHKVSHFLELWTSQSASIGDKLGAYPNREFQSIRELLEQKKIRHDAESI